MKVYDETNIGRRTTNQDKVAIANTRNGQLLAVVCDGMGGHNSGELASKIVCEYMMDCFKIMPGFVSSLEAKSWLEDTIKKANQLTKRQAQTSPMHLGMGTTIVVALVFQNKVYIGNIGDSRCYQIDETITQLTEDDTFVNELIKSGVISKEEAKFHPKRNVLMKAVGVQEDIDVLIQEYDLKQGYLLLCSDGLYNAISENQIYDIVVSENTLERKCHALIDLALKQHGSDNISIALIEVERGDVDA